MLKPLVIKNGLIQCAVLSSSLLLFNAKVYGAEQESTYGFVLSWFAPATTNDDADCPDGLQVAPTKDEFASTQSAEDQALFAEPVGGDFLLLGAKTLRGPDLLNVCHHPESVPVTKPLKTVQTTKAFGLNLTGTMDGQNNPNTCPHVKFADGLNGEDYVDNQYQRVIGCQKGLRSGVPEPGGYMAQAQNKLEMLEGKFTFLVELTGVNDLQNDDDIQIGIYDSPDALEKVTKGDSAQSDSTFRVGSNPLYNSVLKGKIVDGVVWSTETRDIFIPEVGLYTISPHHHMRDVRLRLELTEDGGFEGVLAGYKDWRPMTDLAAGRGALMEINTGHECPALYAAYQEYADGYPDPETGACQAISFAYYLRALPAFILNPNRLPE